MSLLAIIISVLVDRYFAEVSELRRYGWFDRFSAWVADHVKDNKLLDGPLGLLLALLPVVVVVGFVQIILDDVWAIFGLVFGVAVLIYCLGPQDLNAQTDAYINARNDDDEQGAREAAAGLVDGALADDIAQVDRAVAEAVLKQINERWLAVIFWYFILGPVGAALYRFSRLLLRDAAASKRFGAGFTDAALRLHGILAWVPARLTAWGYALTGNFSDARYNWQIHTFDWLDDWVAGNDGVLVASGAGALGIGDRREGDGRQQVPPGDGVTLIKTAMALVRRTAWLWLVVIAVLTLAGWRFG